MTVGRTEFSVGRRWAWIFGSTWVVVAMVWWAVATGQAHPAYLTAAQVTIEDDGRFRASLRFDTLAFALNDTSARIGNEPMEALLGGPVDALEAQLAGARDRLRRGFHVMTDAGEGTVEDVDFPTAATVLAWRDKGGPVLPVVIPARLSGRLPTGARTVAIRFPPVLEQVILTVERPGEEPDAEAVEAGKTSTAWPVRLAPAEVAGAEKGSGAHAGLARNDHRSVDRRLIPPWAAGWIVAVGVILALIFWGIRGGKRR